MFSSHDDEGVSDNILCCCSHADVMKKITDTVAEGGGELHVYMYPYWFILKGVSGVVFRSCIHGCMQPLILKVVYC